MSRAAYPAEELLPFHKYSSSDGLFCAESSNLNPTARVGSNLDYHRCMSSDLIGQTMTMSDSDCCQVPGRDSQALEAINHEGASGPLWLGIKRCSSSLAAAGDKAQQTQPPQQHGIGSGFGDRWDDNGGYVPQIIDLHRVG
jgi:hypothetical protein